MCVGVGALKEKVPVILILVPDYSGIERNEAADPLAGSEHALSSLEVSMSYRFFEIKGKIVVF